MSESPERLRDATLSARSFDPRAADDPPARARAVVIGGGIVGASVAFHLAELGWRDTVVLERGRVGCGTSWHAAGLVTRARGTHAQTEMAMYSRDFYAGLAARSGIETGRSRWAISGSRRPGQGTRACPGDRPRGQRSCLSVAQGGIARCASGEHGAPSSL